MATYFQIQGTLQSVSVITDTTFLNVDGQSMTFDAYAVDLKQGDKVKVVGVQKNADTRDPIYFARVIHNETTGKTVGNPTGIGGAIAFLVMIALTLFVAAMCVFVFGLIFVPKIWRAGTNTSPPRKALGC